MPGGRGVAGGVVALAVVVGEVEGGAQGACQVRLQHSSLAD